MGTVLVAGASGLVGSAAVEHFASLPDWEVIGVSRRHPEPTARTTWLPLDLGDADACAAAGDALRRVTHVVYAAVHEVPGLRPGWTDAQVIRRNGDMLANLMVPVLKHADLQHVSLLQGTKAYGLHHPDVGRSRAHNPLRERAPRIEHPNFYFVQEDFLREHQDRWGLTIFRPTVVYGSALGTNMNLIPVIGVWAALLRAQGEPLHFPGRSVSTQVTEAVDADLVARALRWAAETPVAAEGTFNLTNGDVFAWPHVWPAIADALGMAPGEHRPVRLAEELLSVDAQWAALVDRHRLRAPRRVIDVVGANSLVYADQLLSGAELPGGPLLNSTIAVRQAGFVECIDTEDMFRDRFARLQKLRLLPSL